MTHTRMLAETIYKFTESSDDYNVLSKLSEMAWSIKPLVERPDSGLPLELGQELWLYVGVKRDANPEMSVNYGKRIAKLLELN